MTSKEKISCHRSGFVTILGQPNAGKSTLLNALLRCKLSITSNRPQTTRTAITGVLSLPQSQLVFIDTPGYVQKPRSAIDAYLSRSISSSLTTGDVLVYLADAQKMLSEEERDKEVERIRSFTTSQPLLFCFNKTDLLKSMEQLLEATTHIADALQPAAILYISAEKRKELDKLLHEIEKHLPEQEALFPPDTLTDLPERFLAADFIREKIFRLTSQEIPYHSAVEVIKWEEGKKLLKIYAEIYVTKEGQKRILIGSRGEMMKKIGTSARKALEGFFGIKVFLDLHVKVKPLWRDNHTFITETNYQRDE